MSQLKLMFLVKVSINCKMSQPFYTFFILLERNVKDVSAKTDVFGDGCQKMKDVSAKINDFEGRRVILGA